MKRKILLLIMAAAAGVLLAGCTGSNDTKNVTRSATSTISVDGDTVVPLSDEETADVVAAPEEDAGIDQGREGRPTDSWNADAPAEDDADSVVPIEDDEVVG